MRAAFIYFDSSTRKATKVSEAITLSKRQLEVLKMLDSGLNPPAIADRIGVHRSIIGRYVTVLREKLDTRDVVTKAREIGLLSAIESEVLQSVRRNPVHQGVMK